MKLRNTLGLCLLLAASILSAPTHHVQASAPPDDTGQAVQAIQVNSAEHVLTLHTVPAIVLSPQVMQSQDSTFNPRTDFPRRPAVITAGFSSYTQECCGGSGSWNFADKPQDRTLIYLGAVLLASVLLAAYLHLADRRQQENRRLAAN